MKSTDFDERSVHNEGIVVTIALPKKGASTWFRVRGIESDAYRAAHDGFNQAMVRLATAVRAGGASATLLPATQAEKDAAKLHERVALVAEWGLEDACTTDSVTAFLAKNTSVMDEIWAIAQERDRFFENCSATSTAGQNTNSDSDAQQPQGQSEPSPTP